MTEKRFVYYEHKGADYILDTPNKSLDFIEMLGDCLEAEEIVNLLNCLNDENEQLKQQHRQLQIEFNDACGIVHDLRESKLDLEDENEQLKQHNTELVNKIDFLERIIDGDVE